MSCSSACCKQHTAQHKGTSHGNWKIRWCKWQVHRWTQCKCSDLGLPDGSWKDREGPKWNGAKFPCVRREYQRHVTESQTLKGCVLLHFEWMWCKTHSMSICAVVIDQHTRCWFMTTYQSLVCGCIWSSSSLSTSLALILGDVQSNRGCQWLNETYLACFSWSVPSSQHTTGCYKQWLRLTLVEINIVQKYPTSWNTRTCVLHCSKMFERYTSQTALNFCAPVRCGSVHTWCAACNDVISAFSKWLSLSTAPRHFAALASCDNSKACCLRKPITRAKSSFSCSCEEDWENKPCQSSSQLQKSKVSHTHERSNVRFEKLHSHYV